MQNEQGCTMKKIGYGVLVLAALLAAVLAPIGTEALAGVNVNINFGPPPVVMAEPPAMVMVPRSQVYFAPDPQIDIFFYGGFWWSPQGDRWYRAQAYNGPWVIVEKRYVPAPVYRVPRDYRAVYRKEKHIPYGQWKKEARYHERDDHWEWKDNHKEHDRGH